MPGRAARRRPYPDRDDWPRGPVGSVEDVPAGPWLAALLDVVDPRTLSDWDMPAYLRACARLQAWAAARLSDGIAELASRPEGFGADKEVAIALREPVGAA